MRETAFVALGSNLGDRAAHLAAARHALAGMPESRVVALSQVDDTTPLGGMRQMNYLNQMAAVETGLTPHALLRELQRIEQAGGRTRQEHWGSRTIDLDIVLFGTTVMADADLTIPHPGLKDRDFWKRELAELRTLLGLRALPELPELPG